MKVLVVDDESVVLFLMARVIKDAGFDVLTASTADEAYIHIASHGCDIGAVLTDLHLPQTNGVQMLDYFSKLCPESTKLAVMTGFNNDEIDEKIFKVFHKPFRNQELVAWLQ
jgi:DNA-binding NtrC family response regulator